MNGSFLLNIEASHSQVVEGDDLEKVFVEVLYPKGKTTEPLDPPQRSLLEGYAAVRIWCGSRDWGSGRFVVSLRISLTPSRTEGSSGRGDLYWRAVRTKTSNGAWDTKKNGGTTRLIRVSGTARAGTCSLRGGDRARTHGVGLFEKRRSVGKSHGVPN